MIKAGRRTCCCEEPGSRWCVRLSLLLLSWQQQMRTPTGHNWRGGTTRTDAWDPQKQYGSFKASNRTCMAGQNKLLLQQQQCQVADASCLCGELPAVLVK